MKTLPVKILSHDGCQFEGEVAEVNVPSTNGPFGILPNHTPLITSLVEGNLILHLTAGADKTIAINGGVLDVKKDGVVILMS